MNELKVFVERCVRPVVAEASAKLRMREELYAHLTAAYEQELAHEGDAEQAQQRALARMGTAEQITAELQSSVHWLDRWSGHIDAVMFRPAGMSVWRYASRATIYFGVPFVALLLLLLVFRLPEFLERPGRAVTEMRFVGSIGFVWLMNEFFCVAIFGKACEVFLHRGWSWDRSAKAALLAVAASLEVLFAGWLFTLFTTGSTSMSHLMPYWAVLAGLVGLAMIVVPWLTRVQLRGLSEWRELEIDG